MTYPQHKFSTWCVLALIPLLASACWWGACVRRTPERPPSWTGGWSGRIVLWDEESHDSPGHIVLDHALRFVAFERNWALRVYRLNPDLSLGELLLDTRAEDYGVRGMTWVKGGLIFWAIVGIRTPDEDHVFPGDRQAHYREHSRTYHWDMNTGKVNLVFPDIVTNAISDPSGRHVALFGRSLEQQGYHPPGASPDEVISTGRFDMLDLETSEVRLMKWIDAWYTYGGFDSNNIGMPWVLFWGADNNVYLVSMRDRKVGPKTSRLVSSFGLMALNKDRVLFPLTDLDASVLYLGPAPVLLADGGTVVCVIHSEDPNRDRSPRLAYYTSQGLLDESRALARRDAPREVHIVTFTPDGSGILFHHRGNPAEEQRWLWAWNSTTGKYYRIAKIYRVGSGVPADTLRFGWVENRYYVFASARQVQGEPAAYIPGLLEIRKDLNAEALEPKDWLASIGKTPARN